MVKKFEALMGKFIWNFSGILRIAIDEIKNGKLGGGLNLPCVASMADALLLSQCLRLIRSGDSRFVSHLVICLVTWFLVVLFRETGLKTLQSTLATLVGWWLT